MGHFLFMEDCGNNSSFSRSNSCLLLVTEKKVKSQVCPSLPIFSMSQSRKGDRLSQSRLGYKLILPVLLLSFFAVFILLFIYLFIFSNVHSLHQRKLMLEA